MSGRGNEMIYIVSCELGRESTAFGDDDIAGGFVSCLVPTNDIREALDLAENALIEDGYSIKLIEKVELFDEEEWKENPTIIDNCKEAKQSRQVRYTTFHVFEHEHEH